VVGAEANAWLTRVVFVLTMVLVIVLLDLLVAFVLRHSRVLIWLLRKPLPQSFVLEQLKY